MILSISALPHMNIFRLVGLCRAAEMILSISALPHMKIFRLVGLCRAAEMLELM